MVSDVSDNTVHNQLRVLLATKKYRTDCGVLQSQRKPWAPPVIASTALWRLFQSMARIDRVVGDAGYDQIHQKRAGGRGKHNNQPRLW